jgi:H+/Cl- antiporter ClcA
MPKETVRITVKGHRPVIAFQVGEFEGYKEEARQYLREVGKLSLAKSGLWLMGVTLVGVVGGVFWAIGAGAPAGVFVPVLKAVGATLAAPIGYSVVRSCAAAARGRRRHPRRKDK